MSGRDGWGWKLEDAHDSQAHGVEGEVEHMFWFVNRILWALVQEKALCACMHQELLPCSAVLPEGKSTGSKQRDTIVKINHKKSLFCPQCVFAVLTR